MAAGTLVLGAGELGLAVLEALVRHPKRNGEKIAVLLRQSTLTQTAPDKQKLIQHFKDLGIEIEVADVVQDSVASLAAIFFRYGTVISCNGMGLPAGTQTKLAQAVLQSGVARFFPWQFGMDYDLVGEGSSQDLFDEQLGVRRLLRAQTATDWIIVSTGLFMSFLFVPEFGIVDIEANTVRALGSWDTRITVTTPADIGTVTADVALDPRGINRQVVYAAGDTISYGALAELLDKHFQTQFRRELWDLPALKRQMEQNPDVMTKYRDTFANSRGVAWDKSQTVNELRGIPMTDVAQYLCRFKKS